MVNTHANKIRLVPLTRRLLLGFVAGLGVIGGAAVAWRWLWRPSGSALDPNPRIMARRIREHFDYLNIDDRALTTFVDEHLRHHPDILNPLDVYSKFLMSTDFFQNDADESRYVRYVAYYDPYVTPCYNPLVRRG